MPLPRLIVWAHPSQTPLIDTVRAAGPFEVVGTAAPRPKEAAQLADALGVPRIADLRQALQREDIDAVWLAAPGVEPDTLAGRSATVVSNEPLPRLEPAALPSFAPMFRESPGYTAALDVLEGIGPPSLVNISFAGPEVCGSLFARSYDAMDVIATHAGSVEGVDAALADGTAPERLAELSGNLAVFLRFTARCAGSVTISNQTHGWSRRVEFIGPGGRLLIDDDRFAWWDETRLAPDTGGSDATLGPAHLIAEAIRRRIERPGQMIAPPTDVEAVAGLCEAIRLSARTRQEEAPMRLAEVLRRM